MIYVIKLTMSIMFVTDEKESSDFPCLSVIGPRPIVICVYSIIPISLLDYYPGTPYRVLLSLMLSYLTLSYSVICFYMNAALLCRRMKRKRRKVDHVSKE